jgi:predicted MPP superfamily phosphohydrolase
MTDSTIPRKSSLPPPPAARAIGRKPRMSRFLRVLMMITAAVHVPFAIGVADVAGRLGLPSPWWISLALTAIGIGFFLGRARAGMYDRRRHPLYVRFVDIPYFVHWCACVYPLVQLARGASPMPPAAFYTLTYAMGLLVAGYGVLVRRRVFQVREIQVKIPDLPKAFEGYRIAHLSDLHIGATTPKEWGHRWARAANGRAPDLTVVTGDLVTSGTEYYDDIADVVGALTAKDGTFVSMGNHDYFGDGEPLIAKLRARGARVLRNDGLFLTRGDARLYLCAIDDTWTKRDDMDAALAGRADGVPTVLLAHDPERFRASSKKDVELTLSGHTHGGQIAVPFLSEHLSLSHLTHHFHQGLYTKGRSTLYVHPGLGTTGPPIRIGVAPAVVILTLVPA